MVVGDVVGCLGEAGCLGRLVGEADLGDCDGVVPAVPALPPLAGASDRLRWVGLAAGVVGVVGLLSLRGLVLGEGEGEGEVEGVVRGWCW